MMLVDDQAGSSALFPYIKAISADAILTRIDPPFGDIVWAGEGPDGRVTNIAVEYKQLNDVMACMVDGRFAGHQLPGLMDTFPPPNRIYLLVEYGNVRTDRHTGILQRRYVTRQGKTEWRDIQRNGRGFTFRELEHWYTTMEEFPRLTVARTFDEYESARWVVAKHSWWTSKGWDDHKSIKQFHVPPPPSAHFTKPGLVRRVAKELPSIGWDKSMAVAAKFRSVREMVNANEQTWAEIDGIGKGISRRIVAEIKGEGTQ